MFNFPISCVIMASGISKRFQEASELNNVNKLLVDFKGKPLLQWALDCFALLACDSKIVVAREYKTKEIIPKDTFKIVWNRDANLSPSITIRKGLLAVPHDSTGCLFAVSDQPYLTYSSVYRLCETFQKNPNNIVSLSWKGERGNPVIFPRCLFPELLSLEDGFTGKNVILRHPSLLLTVEAHRSEELMDIDTRKEYLDACHDSPAL